MPPIPTESGADSHFPYRNSLLDLVSLSIAIQLPYHLLRTEKSSSDIFGSKNVSVAEQT